MDQKFPSHPLIALVLSSLMLIVSLNTNGTTATGNLSTSALVTTNCTLSTANLDFGTYDPIEANKSTPLANNVNFQITCTKGANVTISLNNGLYSQNANGTTRAMYNGDNSYLSYELYSDPGYTNVWSTSNPVRYISTSFSPLTKTIYGRIPAGQNIKAGTFIDTVTITATF